MKPPHQDQLGVIMVDEGRVCQQSLKDKLSALKLSYIREKLEKLTADSLKARSLFLSQTGTFFQVQGTRWSQMTTCTHIPVTGH
jgi:hypothetical protein